MRAILSVLLVAGSSIAAAQVIPAGAVLWGPAPPVFPAGARMAVMAGDPSKAGLFVVRLKMPAGYRIPPHHHPTDEMVTVISGDFALGMGDRLDAGKAMTLRPGGFARAGAGMNHFALAPTDAVVEIAAEGPFAMTYVNTADDPRRSP